MKKHLQKLSDLQLSFLFATLGYLCTVFLVTLAMSSFYDFLKATIVPFLLSTYFLSPWIIRKCKSANKKGLAIYWSIVGATLVSASTSFLSMNLWYLFQLLTQRRESIFFNEFVVSNIYYVFFGLVYSCPGVFLPGYFLGSFLYSRKSPKA